MLGTTFQPKTKKNKRSKVHGFLERMRRQKNRTVTGSNIIKKRRAKGRKRLSA